MNNSTLLDETPDFSLVLGGPLFQLFRRGHMSGDALELLHLRILAFLVITWLPLLILSLAYAPADSIKITFLHDFEAQIRFLVALPMLIVGELIVHRRIRPVVRRFVERSIVRSEDLPKFYSALNSAVRLRNSVVAELGLVILVWTVGQWLWY